MLGVTIIHVVITGPGSHILYMQIWSIYGSLPRCSRLFKGSFEALSWLFHSHHPDMTAGTCGAETSVQANLWQAGTHLPVTQSKTPSFI